MSFWLFSRGFNGCAATTSRVTTNNGQTVITHHHHPKAIPSSIATMNRGICATNVSHNKPELFRKQEKNSNLKFFYFSLDEILNNEDTQILHVKRRGDVSFGPCEWKKKKTCLKRRSSLCREASLFRSLEAFKILCTDVGWWWWILCVLNSSSHFPSRSIADQRLTYAENFTYLSKNKTERSVLLCRIRYILWQIEF